MADEPFLEAALDDRSKIVRRQAAAVLALIPESRLRQRLSEVAKTIITVRTPRGAPIGQHTPPDRARAAGIVCREHGSATESSSGLRRASVQEPGGCGRFWRLPDLAVWAERTELSPELILESLKGDDYFGDAMQALVTAASSAGDPSWITALVRWFLGQTSTDLAAIATLLEALPADRRESLSLEMATKAPLTSVDRWTVLTSFDRPWSTCVLRRSDEDSEQKTFRKMSKDAWRLSRAIEAASRTNFAGRCRGFRARGRTRVRGRARRRGDREASNAHGFAPTCTRSSHRDQDRGFAPAGRTGVCIRARRAWLAPTLVSGRRTGCSHRGRSSPT